MRKHLVVLLFLVLTVSMGCASIPKEAPLLSAELGRSIGESRAAHQALVRYYMDEKRARIEEFMFREWLPEFSKNVFGSGAVIEQLKKTIASDNEEELLELIVGLGTRLQKKIDKKRQQLMSPIDDMEKHFASRINNHYDDMVAMNSSLTTLLGSASEVNERQKQVREALNIEDKMTGWMTTVDDVVGKMVEGKDAYEKHKDTIDNLIGKLIVN